MVFAGVHSIGGQTRMSAASKAEHVEMVSIDGRDVRITHPDKLYFSRQTKLSKFDLVRYYLSVAPGALAGIRDRPIVLKRFVNGAEGEAFYQKRAPADRPAWLRTVTLSFPSGRTAEEIVVDDAAGLAWIVNLGCIELHPHPVRSGDLDHPDELRVDLDPGPGVGWGDVRRVATGSASACWRTMACAAGPKPVGREACMSMCGSSRAGVSMRYAAPRWLSRAPSRGACRRLRPRNGGRKSATAFSSTTTRTPRTAPRAPRILCVRCRTPGFPRRWTGRKSRTAIRRILRC